MRSIIHYMMRYLARVSFEADWTDWMSSSMFLWSRLVPSSTWCFVSTLNSFRLHLAPFLTKNSPVEKKRSEMVSAVLSGTSLIPLFSSAPSSSSLYCNPLPTQAAVKVRRFYMVRLQCPCPISLWSEAGLNMPILILPNKLNHAVGRRGEGECWRCWDGWVEGREGSSCQPGLAALCQVWSGHPRRRIINWLAIEGSTGGRRLGCCWPCPWRSHDGWQLKAWSEMKWSKNRLLLILIGNKSTWFSIFRHVLLS